MNIMKELLKPKFIANHKDWWGMLTSTFVGSLFGIGVTFGVSAYLENKHQNEVERKLLLATVSDIDAKCEEFNDEVERLAAVDSSYCMMIIYAIARDEKLLDCFPEDKKKMYLLGQTGIKVYGNGDIDENQDDDSWIASTNTELINIFDDLSTLNSFKNIIATMKKFELLITSINKLDKEILAYDSKYKLDENPDYPDSFMKYQFKYEFKERRSKLYYFISEYEKLKNLNQQLQRDWPIVKEKLGMSEDDIQAAKSNIFDEDWGDASAVDSLVRAKLASIGKVEFSKWTKLKASEQKKEK